MKACHDVRLLGVGLRVECGKDGNSFGAGAAIFFLFHHLTLARPFGPSATRTE